MADLREEFASLFTPKLEKKASAVIKDEMDILMEKEAMIPSGAVNKAIANTSILGKLGMFASDVGGAALSGAGRFASVLGKVPFTAGAIGLGLGGAYGINSIMQANAQRDLNNRLEASFEQMYNEYPVLKKMPPVKARRAFDVLAKMAPDMADSPTIAGAYVVQQLEAPELDYMSFNPTAIGHLASTQKALTDSRVKAQAGNISPLKDIASMAPVGFK